MKNTTRASLLGAAIIASFNAHAVPISFEFSGIVQTVSAGNEDWFGQLATGRFLVETDNFTILPTPPPTVTWTDVQPFDARPPAITASITVGDDFISLNDAVETYGGIHFTGACAPFCSPGWSEGWGITGNTQSMPLGGQPGPEGLTLSSLSFSSRGPAETDFIADTGLTPLDILTLPLNNLYGSYTSYRYDCPPGAEECSQTDYVTAQFLVTTVRRALVPTSVPEPATLGLLGAGLLGAAFLRRRRSI